MAVVRQTPRTGPDMSNPFGIALGQSWLGSAAAEGLSETVIAAVALLHAWTVEEIVSKHPPRGLAVSLGS
jgi:hypothetical protein